MNRARAGWCAVPNPFNARQVSRISLDPARVEAVVFWTRDPRPLLPSLRELADLGMRSVFQFTLVEYPPALHPGMPPLAERIGAFLSLSRAVGPERVLWRYDPVVLSQRTDTDFHARSFAGLCAALSGYTHRVTVSLLEPYRKIHARMVRAGVDLLAPEEAPLRDMFISMAETASNHGMMPVSCADETGLDAFGFAHGSCIDSPLLERLFSIAPVRGKDPSQRPACRCAISRDIGMYDACTAGCVYCYATSDFAKARRARAEHDPHSPSLLGRHVPVDDQHPLIPL